MSNCPYKILKNEKSFFLILIMSFLHFSCKDVNSEELSVIPIDIDSDTSVPISMISADITAIELESGDKSIINPDQIRSVHLFEEKLIVHVQNKIFIFTMGGKFVRSIGSTGQGPGEFNILLKLAVDEKNKRLIVVDHSKIICYDLNGEFLFQSSAVFEKGKQVYDINRIDDEMFALVDQIGAKDTKGLFSQPQLYTMSDDFQIIDSITIRKTYYETLEAYGYMWTDLILNANSKSYFYSPDHPWIHPNVVTKAVLHDTLYRFENKKLVPELKLRFKNNWLSGDTKIIEICSIYRSERFVFAVYINRGFFSFCYDAKTRKGYNMKNGFTDDIHNIEKRISIRPFASNTEFFYYWHTHISEDNLYKEPNPTLYIGRLKK